jgi:hypothetical protein
MNLGMQKGLEDRQKIGRQPQLVISCGNRGLAESDRADDDFVYDRTPSHIERLVAKISLIISLACIVASSMPWRKDLGSARDRKQRLSLGDRVRRPERLRWPIVLGHG